MVNKKTNFVKELHAKVRQHMERMSEQYVKQVNKGCKQVIFEPGDWIWVHMRKERFPSHWRSKLQSRGNAPFQILARINDNAYKLDLPGEYNVSATFNVYDLSPFDIGDDLRTNPFEKKGNDGVQVNKHASKDPLHIREGPITRACAKKMREALNRLIEDVRAKTLASPTLEEQQHLVHFMHIQAWLFRPS